MLAELEARPPVVAEQPFAEQLSQLLNFADAAVIAGAQQGSGGVRRPDDEPLLTPEQAVSEVEQLRETLTRQIQRSCSLDDPPRRLAWPRPKPGQSPAEAGDFEPYQRFYLMLQRELDMHTRQLRARLRYVLAEGNPDQQRVAALDAAFDDTLWRHARRGFAYIPLRLKAQHKALLSEHLAQRAEHPEADDPLQWSAPGGWLVGFVASMQALLLAELDVRIQPLTGLLAALRASGSPR